MHRWHLDFIRFQKVSSCCSCSYCLVEIRCIFVVVTYPNTETLWGNLLLELAFTIMIAGAGRIGKALITTTVHYRNGIEHECSSVLQERKENASLKLLPGSTRRARKTMHFISCCGVIILIVTECRQFISNILVHWIEAATMFLLTFFLRTTTRFLTLLYFETNRKKLKCIVFLFCCAATCTHQTRRILRIMFSRLFFLFST